MTEFLNPYHFVPVTSRDADDPHTVNLNEFDAGSPRAAHLTHDRYVPDTLSGRLICRLTTVSPMVVGGRRTPGGAEEAARIEPYEVTVVGDTHPEGWTGPRPAIPASSLRGLVSSIAEAASNSSLRILEDETYSFRRPMRPPGNLLSAIGMIVGVKTVDGDTTLKLRPLTLPTIRLDARGRADFRNEDRSIYARPNLRVHFGNSGSIRAAAFTHQTYRPDRPVFYGLELPRWTEDREFPIITTGLEGHYHIRNGLLLGYRAVATNELVRWDDLTSERRTRYVRGILRILGCDESRDMPNGKKHEVFIPYPEGAEAWPTIPIAPEAIDRFHELADQRTKASLALPFEPRGTERGGRGGRFRLKDGDLVYFRAKNGRVVEVALSSIWRGRVEDSLGSGASARAFFGTVDSELLPFHASRKTITPAEQVFGFVQTDRGADSRQKQRALAGRVRFADAQCVSWPADGPYSREEVTLRILGSPKPPCPALYFKPSNNPAGGGYIAKADLSPGRHHPQGRKFYLHNPAWERKPWISMQPDVRREQKSIVRPVREGCEFYFHVDFDNLTTHELGMLAFALHPVDERWGSDSFHHKLGMGKALGLGSVRIEVVGLFIVQRELRYSRAGFLDGGRYGRVWVPRDDAPSSWPPRYKAERQVHATQANGVDLARLRQTYASTIQPAILNALRLLGDPRPCGNDVVVHTPLVANGDGENETFRWFAANDRGGHQALKPIAPGDTQLRPLRDLPG